MLCFLSFVSVFMLCFLAMLFFETLTRAQAELFYEHWLSLDWAILRMEISDGWPSKRCPNVFAGTDERAIKSTYGDDFSLAVGCVKRCTVGISPSKQKTLATMFGRLCIFQFFPIQREEVMRKVFVSEKVSSILDTIQPCQVSECPFPNKWTERKQFPAISSHVNLVRNSTQAPRQVLMSDDVHAKRLSNSWEITMSSCMH